MKRALPRTAVDTFRLGPGERVLYRSIIAIGRLSGRWHSSAKRTGDLAKMGLVDKAYWLAKADRPLVRPRRSSDIKEYLDAMPVRWEANSQPTVGTTTLDLAAVGDLMHHPFLVHSRDTLFRDLCGSTLDVDLVSANLECVLVDSADADLTFSTSSGPALSYRRPELEVALEAFPSRSSDT